MSANDETSNDKEGYNIWYQFKQCASDIRKWAAEFLAALQKAPLSSQTQKEVIDVCVEYFELLQKTSGILQECRHATKLKFNVIAGIEKVFKMLRKCALRKEEMPGKTMALLTKQLVQKIRGLNTLINDETTLKNVQKLQNEWKQMSAKIMDVDVRVAKDSNDYRNKMCEYPISLCILALKT